MSIHRRENAVLADTKSLIPASQLNTTMTRY